MESARPKHTLKKGDLVMVIAGGNAKKRPNIGKTGKIVRFVGAERAVVEGVNFMTRHQRQTGPNKPSGKISTEASIHISNLMFYVEKIKLPVRLKHKTLADGKKVRGYLDKKTKEFVQI
ncbi:MAG: 50S ribosomal protein L24 [Deltaproteobacteria bacterium]|nr:50S ribosomal protein L24 [Deltaproteobacteria bacterium]